MRVWYGIDKLNKIMKKPAISVVFENEPGGDFIKREKKVHQRMHVVHVRRQTEAEESDAVKSNRIFTTWSMFLYEKPYNGDIEFLLQQNYIADKNHVSETQRKEIMKKLRKKALELYPDAKKGGTQLKFILE